MNSPEQPSKMVPVAQSAPSNDELVELHEAHYKTSVDNIPSIVKVDISAACQSEAMCIDKTAKQADSTVPGSTKEEDNGSCSAGTSVDITDTSQDNLNVDSSQTHSLSEDLSHFPAALQSNQPSEQDISENSGIKYGSVEKQMKTDEALHENAGDCQIYSRADEGSHDTDLGRYCLSNGVCSSHVDGDALGTQVTAVEIHAAMKTDGLPGARDALPTQIEKEVSMVEVSTDVHNDHGSHVSCEEAMVRTGSDSSTQSHTNEDGIDTIDTTQQPTDKTNASPLLNSDMNQQSRALKIEDDPPTTILATIESDKATGDADIISYSRLESSGIEIETVHILQTEEAPTGGELIVASHTEALVEQTQEASVPNKEEIIDTVVLKQDCNTEPCGDAAVAREVSEEMDQSAERQVSELAETWTEPTEMICDPEENESVLAAGLENDCSGRKHDDSTASEHVVAPEPIKNESSAMQVEHEATEKEDGCCTAASSFPSSEAIKELEAHEEAPAAEVNETIAGVEVCMDPKSHVSSEVSMSIQSSDLNLSSAIQQQTEMVSVTVPAPTSNKEITQGNFLKCMCTDRHAHAQSAIFVPMGRIFFATFIFFSQ
jgi:hypothetical protein